MEKDELNKRIIEKVRNAVVISNLEREEKMKLSKRKQVLSFVAVMVIMFAGSFVTVNAATNGELVNKVKEGMKVIFVKENGKQEEVKGKAYTDSQGHNIEQYEVEDGGTNFSMEIDKNNAGTENLNVNGTIKKDEVSIDIEKAK